MRTLECLRRGEGGIPHISLGRYIRFDAADVERWVQEQKQGWRP